MFMFKRQPSVQTIILDRTSALTDNQLVVKSVWQPRHASALIGDTLSRTIITSKDPLDQALSAYTQSHAGTMNYHPMRQFEFTQKQGMSGNLWHRGAEFILTVKGSPEQVIGACDLSDNERESITLQLHALSSNGDYIVAFARTSLDKPIKRLAELSRKTRLQFVGFASLSVSIPASTRQLLQVAARKGAAVYMLTGQHPAASYYTASQLGLAARPSDIVDADTLNTLPDEEIRHRLGSSRVIARADAQQKARLVSIIRSIDSHALSVDTLTSLQDCIDS